MGVWIGGLIANEGKSKVKCKLNQNQKKSKCMNYVIMDSVFASEFDCLRTVSLILIVTGNVIPLERLSRVACRVSRIGFRASRIAYRVGS
jgi:hypothetical protein